MLDYKQNVKFSITFMTVRGHNMAILKSKKHSHVCKIMLPQKVTSKQLYILSAAKRSEVNVVT